ncbi:MAG TPA: quinoprotein dehydrogenase-associated putative ABC transporter substrate-binding protein [Woeseiaceae bacterium]|nr:quinoprotein dehydrogenase-associated putative ABC transporter substrate-binding protein [Woeseiaceae bacterium]
MHKYGLKVALLIAVAILAQPAAALEREAFRVCADPNNLPFSHKNLKGFENQLAELWADHLGLEVQYTWFPQRIGFVRNTLGSKNEHNEYKCDVVMGVAEGFDQLMTTKPYYRSTYALVYIKGRELDDVRTGRDLLNLDAGRKANLRIGAFDKTPGPTWLQRHNMLDQMRPYQAMSGDPEDYPGEILEQALVDGEVDAAIIWGPIAGYFSKQAQDVEMVVIPLESEPGVQFDYGISAGVRRGDDEGKAQLEQLMNETDQQIQALLLSYNVPLLPPEVASAKRADDDD